MENDSLVLGRVKEIHKYKLIISLPHNVKGVCLISSISEQYNELLSELTDDSTKQNEVAELNKMFSKGQLLQVKLIKTIGNNKCDLTLMPSAVNGNLNISRLKRGMKIQVAIKSKEDKGYILETGVGGLNGFLPFENCLKKNYEIGMIIEVYPIISDNEKTAIKSRVINFTTDPSFNEQDLSYDDYTFDSILPGMLIRTAVTLSSKNNLEGKFNGFPINVNSDHHKISESHKNELLLTVIGIDSTLKHLDCSALGHLRSPYKGAEELLNVQIGHSYNDAVIRTVKKNQIFLSIPDYKYSACLVTKSHIEENISEMEEGATVVARVLDYNLLDNLILFTTLKRLVSLSYFSVHQAKLGEIIKGKVKKFTKSGYSVQISSQLTGLIPIPHLSDKKVTQPNIIYQIGDEVQCRVFHIDKEENKLLLTVKKSLMKSTLPLVNGYQDFVIGMQLDGFVASIMEFGLVVILFNNIKAWVPISKIPESNRKSMSLSYYIGKPVVVKLIRWDENTNKIELSLLTEEEIEGDESLFLDNNLSVGNVYDAVIKQTRPDGFNVMLLPLKKIAFLPFNQLSDSRDHQSLFQAHYTSSIAEEKKILAVIINIHEKKIIVSTKKSLVNSAVAGTMLTKKDSIVVDSQWIGWVIKKESYGLFVELPIGVKGLVRNKDISDFKPAPSCQSSDLFEIGDTVEIKVTEIDPTKPNRLLFSLKMSDTYRAKDHMKVGAIDFLINHLEERKYLKENSKVNREIEIGDLVNVIITKQCEWGFTLKLKDVETSEEGLSGFVRNQFLPENVVTEGSNYDAIVIDIDLSEKTIEVCMIGSMVNAVRNRRDDCTKIKIGSTISSEVLFFNQDYVVAMLKGHAHGNVVFIPTKRFWNDMSKKFVWILKQTNQTVIKTELQNGIFIGSLLINEPINCPKQVLTSTNTVVKFKDLPKKIKIQNNTKYSAYFHSITKNKIFFYVSKRQKGFCNLIEYSNSVEELQNFIMNPPAIQSLMEKEVTITDKKVKTNGLATGHFLSKNIVEVDDLVCCKVISKFKKNKYRLKLPFDLTGYVDPSKLKIKVAINARINSIVECKVVNISKEGSKINYFMSIANIQRLEDSENGDQSDSQSEVQSENLVENSEETNQKVHEKMEIENSKKDDNQNKVEEENGIKEDEEIPIIIRKRKSKECSENLSSVFKRIHHSDDKQDKDEEDLEDSSQPTPAKKMKSEKISQVERELAIRNAEKRRDFGEHLKNPINEAEYELLLFNNPNNSNSWIKYMRFYLETENNVDKCRGIAERAMKTLQVRDVENRFRIMKEYIDLEIKQLVLSKDNDNYDNDLKRFTKILDRGFTQKAKHFYIHVCQKLLDSQLFELAENIAKRFIKDFHFDSVSWFYLFLIRFVQKKFSVVKETIVNAERCLKANEFRDLNIRVAQTEIEQGDVDRGVQILISLCIKRPKDNSLKQRVIAILNKNDLTQHIPKLEQENIVV